MILTTRAKVKAVRMKPEKTSSARTTKVKSTNSDGCVAMCHIPAFGGAIVTIAVSNSRVTAFNYSRRAFGYDRWGPLTSEEDMGGWTLPVDSGQLFVWIQHPRFSPNGAFSFENVAAHELTHVLCALLGYIHANLDVANEPSAYTMGWLFDACVAIRDRDIRWLDREGFRVRMIPKRGAHRAKRKR